VGDQPAQQAGQAIDLLGAQQIASAEEISLSKGSVCGSGQEAGH